MGRKSLVRFYKPDLWCYWTGKVDSIIKYTVFGDKISTRIKCKIYN